MDIDLLRTFLEVRRRGNFRAAAEQLHVSQAAVSQRIKHLEGIVGAQLFVRQKNSIYVTIAGEQLAPAAESILETWYRAREAISAKHSDRSVLALGVRSGIWPLLGADVLGDIYHARPELILDTLVLDEDSITARLQAQTLDLALLAHRPTPDSLRCVTVGTFELALFSRSLISLDNALAGPWVEVSWGIHDKGASERSMHFTEAPCFMTGDYTIAEQFIVKNGGSAILPVAAVSSNARMKRVQGSVPFPLRIFAVWHPKNPRGDLIHGVVDLLRATNLLAKVS